MPKIYNHLDTINKEELDRTLRRIQKEYRLTDKAIEAEIQQIYKKAKYRNGKLITKSKVFAPNRKEIQRLVASLWVSVGAETERTAAQIFAETLLLYEFVDKQILGLNARRIDIPNIVEQAIEKRNKKINFKKVIGSNSRRLNKKLQKEIKKAVVSGKTENETKKLIRRTMRNNRGKAGTVARTELNYYRTDAKLVSGKISQRRGAELEKEWVYTYRSVERREHHVAANGQTVDFNEPFVVGGKETMAPQHFGDASEDINCSCVMRVKHKGLSDKQLNVDKYDEYKEERNG